MAAGKLRLSWLELDGAPIAIEYSFTGGDTVYYYQGGFDPAVSKLGPGWLMTALSMRAAIAEGYRYFDFLRGDEPYKASWNATPRPLVERRVAGRRPDGAGATRGLENRRGRAALGRPTLGRPHGKAGHVPRSLPLPSRRPAMLIARWAAAAGAGSCIGLHYRWPRLFRRKKARMNEPRLTAQPADRRSRDDPRRCAPCCLGAYYHATLPLPRLADRPAGRRPAVRRSWCCSITASPPRRESLDHFDRASSSGRSTGCSKISIWFRSKNRNAASPRETTTGRRSASRFDDGYADNCDHGLAALVGSERSR